MYYSLGSMIFYNSESNYKPFRQIIVFIMREIRQSHATQENIKEETFCQKFGVLNGVRSQVPYVGAIGILCTTNGEANNNNNKYYYYYLLQLGCHPVAVVILHVYKM